MTLGCQVSGGCSENTGQILTSWVKHLCLKEAPSPVHPVVCPCSQTGHLDSAPGKESAKRVSWGHWKDTGPRKGTFFSAGLQGCLCPSRVAKWVSGPSKGKATSPHRNVVSLGGEPASWGDGRTHCCYFSSSSERLPPPVPQPRLKQSPRVLYPLPPNFSPSYSLRVGFPCTVADAVPCPEQGWAHSRSSAQIC